MITVEPSQTMLDRACLEIAHLRIGLEAGDELSELLKIRYAGFLAESAEIGVTLEKVQELRPKFGKNESIPEIQYLEGSFEIDQAPYFFLQFDTTKQTGTLKFTETPREVSKYVPPERSPLPFGLRRGIGVLFVTLLAQDRAPAFHASALNVNGQGIMAPGDSGTGKSTFFGMFPEPMHLNDEFVVVRNDNSGSTVYSTPFSEDWDKERQNRSAPLRCIIKLEQSPEIESFPLKKQEVLKILNHNMVLPAEAERECESNFLELFAIAQNVHGQRLRFSLDGEKVLAKVHSVVCQP